MRELIDKIRAFCEVNYFGVCERLSEKIGVSSSSVRLFFIYATFITSGVSIFVYLVLAFTMNIRKYLRNRFEVFKSF